MSVDVVVAVPAFLDMTFVGLELNNGPVRCRAADRDWRVSDCSPIMSSTDVATVAWPVLRMFGTNP